MRQHHNVLYITHPKASLHQQDAAILVKRGGESPVRIPRHHLEAIVCFGPAYVTPYLMRACAEEGISISFLGRDGRFMARVVGPQHGNVLLRRAQFSGALEGTEIARSMLVGKLANCRTLLRRGARGNIPARAVRPLSQTAERMTGHLRAVQESSNCASLRGIEGAAAAEYFACFPHLLRGDECFSWGGRSRRPPRDPTNAVLSFLYSLLTSDCRSAAESVGLDPQVGFLHVEKSGRPALGLDLAEEFRPVLADRTLLALVNRRQLQSRHFERQAGGAVLLTDEGRRIVLEEYQSRKRLEVQHPFLETTTTYGLLPLIQARLLARHLRGDLDAYPPFLAS